MFNEEVSGKIEFSLKLMDFGWKQMYVKLKFYFEKQWVIKWMCPIPPLFEVAVAGNRVLIFNALIP